MSLAASKPIDASFVKQRAKQLGADLVGIASAATLNAFPPDPRWPQTPERISPYCKSVIVIVQRIPAGAFRCKTNTPVQYLEKLADVARAITYRSDCCIDILGLAAECGGESVNCAPIPDVHASFIAVRLDRVDCERHCDSVDSVIAIVRPIGLSVLDLQIVCVGAIVSRSIPRTE